MPRRLLIAALALLGTLLTLECTGPGYAHLVVGLTITGSGAVGTLVSGIVLGARKRNQRLLNRSIQRRPAQGFHWDPRLGAFVF